MYLISCLNSVLAARRYLLVIILSLVDMLIKSLNEDLLNVNTSSQSVIHAIRDIKGVKLVGYSLYLKHTCAMSPSNYEAHSYTSMGSSSNSSPCSTMLLPIVA